MHLRSTPGRRAAEGCQVVVGRPGLLGLVLNVGFEQLAPGSGVVLGLVRSVLMNCARRGSAAESRNS